MTNLPAWKNVISGGLLPNGSPLYYYSPAPSFGGGGSGSVAYADTAGTASYVDIRGNGIIVNYGASFISLTGSGGSGSSSVSSSYAETASFAFYAVSASHEIIQELSSSYADTASQAISSSYASTASFVNILGNKIIVNNYPGGIQLTGSDTVATASYVQLNYGPGIIPDPITPMAFSASVRSVNGIFPTNGNINTALVGVTTGTSASLSVSSSGAITGSLNEGEVWVISNDPTSSNNGRSFIYDEDNTTGIGTWYELAPTDLATMDARYLKLDGANSPLQGNVNLGGYDLTNGDLIGTSSWAITSSNAVSASYAATASQALTASYINVTGSNVIVNWSGNQLQLTGSGDAKVIISGSIPGTKDAGALWFNSNDGNTYIQYIDPTGSTWIPATTNVGQAFSASYANSSLSSSFAQTASLLLGSVTSASYAITASYTINTDGWSANNPTSISAVTTAPTKPTNRIIDYSRYKITGNKSATVYFNLSYLDTSGVNNGNGQYIFNLPPGINFDTSVHPLYSADNSSTGVDNGTIQMIVYSIPACGYLFNNGVDASERIIIVPYTSTSYRVVYGWGTGENTIISSNYSNVTNTRAYKWQFDIVTA
jgi:hypothetical protein